MRCAELAATGKWYTLYMHEHHITLRLLIRLVSIVLIGIAGYLLIFYGLPALSGTASVHKASLTAQGA